MPVGLFPDVRFPRIAVTVDAGDRPADQTEAVITRPVEQALRAIPGVAEPALDHQPRRGGGVDQLRLGPGHGPGALQRVQAALTGAQASLPAGVTFDVRRQDPTVDPVAAYSLTSARATPVELRRFADLTLAPVLSTIDGVARVQNQGGAPGEYRVEADPAKLWAHGLSLADVVAGDRRRQRARRRRPHRGPGQAAAGAHRLPPRRSAPDRRRGGQDAGRDRGASRRRRQRDRRAADRSGSGSPPTGAMRCWSTSTNSRAATPSRSPDRCAPPSSACAARARPTCGCRAWYDQSDLILEFAPPRCATPSSSG